MTTTKMAILPIIRLAEQVLADIRTKGLAVGDPYLNMRETALMLGVSSSRANRALQLLVKRNVLRRRQRSGTFVAEGINDDSRSNPAIRRVHFLVHRKYLTTEGMNADEVLMGLQSVLPGANVQINLLSTTDEREHVRGLIDDALRARELDAFVLVRAPLGVHRIIAESGLPAVVHGSNYASVGKLASLNRDMAAIGRIGTEFFLQRGVRRLVYLARQQVLSGDCQTLDAIQDALQVAGLGLDSLVVRTLPTDETEAEAVIARILADRDLSTGVICRNARLADGVASAARAAGLALYDDIGIVVCDYFLRNGEIARYPYFRPLIDIERQGARIGKMLARQAADDHCNELHETVPVELNIPSGLTI